MGKDDSTAVVILAAGHGTRMKSELPKVMHELTGKPIVAHIVETLEMLGFTKERLILVVGFSKEMVQDYFGDRVTYAVQKEQKGTAHAAYVGMQVLPQSVTDVLVIGGDDSAFYHADTLQSFFLAHIDGQYMLSLLSTEVEHSEQYGRIVRHEDGIIEVIEKEYVTPEQAKIIEVSTGTYCFHRAWYERMYPSMPPLRKLEEYGLPTSLAMAVTDDVRYQVVTLNDSKEWFGINTPEELEEANRMKHL